MRADAIERTALALFASNGFDDTTVVDLARAAGVGRRTFFRYFASKSDVVLGALDTQLATLRAGLAAQPPQTPALEAARRAFRAVNDYPTDQLPALRTRMRLLTEVPELVGHAAQRYREWERALAGDFARRPGTTDPLDAAVAAKAAIAAMEAAFDAWLAGPEATGLPGLVDRAFGWLTRGS